MQPIATGDYNGVLNIDANGNVYREKRKVNIYNIDNSSQTAIIEQENGVSIVHFKQLENIQYLPK